MQVKKKVNLQNLGMALCCWLFVKACSNIDLLEFYHDRRV